jgi:transcription initiation factor IIE alpha subunit
MTNELKIKLNPKLHKGYFICKRFNVVVYVYKEAVESKYGWQCPECGQFTKLDGFYHDGEVEGKII